MSTTHSGIGSSSGVQRRKTTRSKSKQKQQQQQQQRNVAENIIENQNESNEQNERLHFRSRSATSAAAAESPALASVGYNSPSPLCCNGLLSTTTASLLCCRDVNCHLNAPLALPLRGSVERSQRSESRQSFLTDTSKPTSTTTPTPTPTPTASSASLTSASKKSRSRSRSCSYDAAAGDAGKGKHNASSGVCDSSSDRGSGTAAQFTVSLHIDLFSWGLFLLAFLTRFYRLATPKHVV